MPSRLSQITEAVRPQLKARLMLQGGPGSGKTRSGLIMATALADGAPILVIDTERESALTYADHFRFKHLAWSAPYRPSDLAETIDELGSQFGVVIVDSASHFWNKEGGTIDIANRNKNSFAGWADARPIQERMVQAILGCGAHIIVCCRADFEHVQDVDASGKKTVTKLGLKAKQDSDLEYEMNVVCQFDQAHTATITKSRCPTLPVNEVFPAHRMVDLADVYKGWLAGGEPPAAQAVVDSFRERITALPTLDARNGAKAEWRSTLGPPDLLRENQVPIAEGIIARWTGSASTSNEDPVEVNQQAPAAPGGPVPSAAGPSPAVEDASGEEASTAGPKDDRTPYEPGEWAAEMPEAVTGDPARPFGEEGDSGDDPLAVGPEPTPSGPPFSSAAEVPEPAPVAEPTTTRRPSPMARVTPQEGLAAAKAQLVHPLKDEAQAEPERSSDDLVTAAAALSAETQDLFGGAA